ncbi:hypothetical protein [Sporosalibacterium faouarense]|uniref:hypothetical protein n=1 Tax=Sporosalibacterium faouarense TaxID=516123 RepID=UPI00192B72FD|nr:hypothetical protein [Sporosalibacterium faouarense]
MIDFDKELDKFIAQGNQGTAIKDIHNLIPCFTDVQLEIIHSLQFFADKYDLFELDNFIANYMQSKVKNKNLNFLKSMNVKSLLKAYTQDELIRGIKYSRMSQEE